jgi:hypothetical protein
MVPKFKDGFIALLVFAFFATASTAFAQTDEIQVYDAEIAAPGIFNLTLHNNFTPEGRPNPQFPGGLIPDKSWNGVPEWAYGVVDWFEAGLYMPLYSFAKNDEGTFNGFKLRELFVSPHAADRTFFYGINFEESYNAPHWEETRFSGEIRPILGVHVKQFDLIVNPIVDTQFHGGFKDLEFVPATRVAYNFSDTWAVAVEEYDDFGPLRRFDTSNEQFHEIFGVVDCKNKIVDVEFGTGFGLTSGSDKLTLKLILSRDLN